VLDHFNASSDEYTAVFVANATAACRLVAEAFPFDSGTRFVATADNHNSVNGIREYARAKHSRVQYASGSGEDLRVDDESLRGVT
jgi:selenocysteine lyase/cysteine desulfurase